ncbi:hypothetical protein NGM37_24335, partial [Streptomyces sp. TRM76130]|nr:hypothetical protein [Streptomyces sp. TRM76130]
MSASRSLVTDGGHRVLRPLLLSRSSVAFAALPASPAFAALLGFPAFAALLAFPAFAVLLAFPAFAVLFGFDGIHGFHGFLLPLRFCLLRSPSTGDGRPAHLRGAALRAGAG